MADEQDHWLDGDAAERLLRGEPLDAVDDHARAEAERLSAALGAVRGAHPHDLADHARTSGELPGEAAALAAFRAARHTYSTRVDGAPASATRGAAVLRDGGAVRIGGRAPRTRTRWGRPVRYGLAAAVAACTLGGVAMAGVGVIPTPFGGRDEPGPAASVSAAPSDTGPSASPSPEASESGPDIAGSVTPDDTGHRSPTGHPSLGTGHPSQGGATASPDATRRSHGDRQEWYARVVAGCRDYLAGKPMDADNKRRIEEAAKGPEGARKFCAKVVAGADGKNQDRGGSDGDGSGGNGVGSGPGEGSGDDGDQDEDGGAPGSGNGNRPEENGGTGGVVTPTASAPASATPTATSTAYDSSGGTGQP